MVEGIKTVGLTTKSLIAQVWFLLCNASLTSQTAPQALWQRAVVYYLVLLRSTPSRHPTHPASPEENIT